MRAWALLLIGCALLGAEACGSDSPPPQPDSKRQSDLFPSVDTAPPPCSPATCPGCCDGNACRDGINKTFCGAGGVTCAQCSESQECQSGRCKSVDCQSTCTGCCGPSCENGTTAGACGSGGKACVKCAAGESGVARTCTQTADKRYRVILESAMLTSTGVLVCTAPGYILDLDCDCYALFKVGAQAAQSKGIENNNSPVWNEELLTASAADLSQGFTLDLQDKDPISSSPLCRITYSVTPADLTAGVLNRDCKDWPTGFTQASVRLQFKAVAP